MASTPMTKRLRCACGDGSFSVRLDRDEQAGLVTCARGHHSLLLDSRDHWHDVIQDGRPRPMRCRCRGDAFAVELAYEIRDDGDVRSVAIELQCIACSAVQRAATFEIDYSPTAELIDRPLDPCPEPWRKAKQTTLTGLWLPADLESVVCHLGEGLHAQCHLALWKQRPVRDDPRAICRALGGAQVFDVYVSAREVAFSDRLRDCWKQTPVLHISSPIHMRYRTGEGDLYYLRWAREIIVGAKVVPQQGELLDLAGRLTAWLAAHFTSERGAQTFDNPSEYERLRGGW